MITLPEKNESFQVTQTFSLNNVYQYRIGRAIRSLPTPHPNIEIHPNTNSNKFSVTIQPGTRFEPLNIEYKLSNSHKINRFYLKFRIHHPSFKGLMYATRSYIELDLVPAHVKKLVENSDVILAIP